MNLAGKKLLICEEALTTYYGHFYAWIKSIREMHTKRGATVSVAANLGVLPEIQDELNAFPAYSLNSWDQTVSSKWPAWRRYCRVFAQNWRVFWQTRKALRKTGKVDMLFFTAVRVHHLLGLRALFALYHKRMFDRLVVFILTTEATYNDDFSGYTFKKSSLLIRTVLRSFGKYVHGGQVTLAGDSHVTCGEYETLAGVPMQLFPSPSATLQYVKPQAADADAPIVFTLLGTSTYEKGIDLFQDAILRILEKDEMPGARFVLQWGVDCIDHSGRKIEIHDRLRNSARVSLHERSLTGEEYATLFTDADFIILPYRRFTYVNRLSGLAVEAACSAKPMIVTSNTWLSWAVREFGCGHEISEDSVEELHDALKECYANVSCLKAAAHERSRVALDYNSQERYLKLLWERPSLKPQLLGAKG